MLTDDSKELVHRLRAFEIGDSYTVGQVWETIKRSESWKTLLAKEVNISAILASPEGTGTLENQSDYTFSVGEAFEQLQLDKLMELIKDYQFGKKSTLGEVIDYIADNPDVQKMREQSITVEITIGQLINIIGEERAKDIITQSAAKSSQVAAYERSVNNILDCWFRIGCFIFGFAILSMLFLESIDRDRR